MEELKNYIIHKYLFDCKVASLFKQYGDDTIIESAISLLDTLDENQFNVALTFIRDCYVGSDLSKKEAKHYIEKLKEHNSFKIICSFLYSPKQGIRTSTIYNLGKFSVKGNTENIISALSSYYIYHDCLCVFNALFEINWLNYKKIEKLYDLIVESNFIFNKIFLLLHLENQISLFQYYYNTLSYKCRVEICNLIDVADINNTDDVHKQISDIIGRIPDFYSNIMRKNKIALFSNHEFETVVKYYLLNYQSYRNKFNKAVEENELDFLYREIYKKAISLNG